MKIESELLFTIEIQKELKNGNTGRTKHWSSAHKDKQAWVRAISRSDILTATGVSLDLETFKTEVLLSRPIQQRVGIVVERVLGKRQRNWDPDSALRGSKELIDSIVFHGILADDSHKYVAWCVGLQDDTIKDQGPFTRVHFYNYL